MFYPCVAAIHRSDILVDDVTGWSRLVTGCEDVAAAVSAADAVVYVEG